MVWLQLIIALGMLTAGCDHILYQRFEKSMWTNYIHLNDVKLGMSKADVLGIMGPPGIKEDGDYRGGHYTIYFYLTHSMDFPESNTVRNGFTPLVFQKDRLVGMGKRDYRQAVDRPEADSVPKQDDSYSRTH